MQILIIILGIVLDRITKLWAVNILKSSGDIIILREYFKLSYLENRGAAFGIFQNRILFLIIFTITLITLLSIYLYKNSGKSKMLSISLSIIISGALGNFYDRLFYKYVVDFICIHYKETYYFPTFNVADILVVCGTILLAIYIIKEDNNG